MASIHRGRDADCDGRVDLHRRSGETIPADGESETQRKCVRALESYRLLTESVALIKLDGAVPEQWREGPSVCETLSVSDEKS